MIMKRIFTTLASTGLLFIFLSSNGAIDNKAVVIQPKEETSLVGDTSVTTLVLEKIAIGDANTKDALTMNEKGHLSAIGKEVGVLSTNGELKDSKGNLLAKMTGETFTDAEGNVISIIKEDGTIINSSGKDLSWDKNGLLKNSEIEVYLTPANTKAKRAASILLFNYFIFTKSQPQETK